MKAREVTFDQMEVFGKKRHTEPKIVFGKTHRAERYFPQPLGKLISSPGSKSNKEATLKIRETCFFYRNPHEIKNYEKKFLEPFDNFFQKTFLNSVSCIVSKH